MLQKSLLFLRKYNNYTQEEIADFIGVSKSTYSRYESGKTFPDIETVNKFAQIYNVSIDTLMYGFDCFGEPFRDYNFLLSLYKKTGNKK